MASDLFTVDVEKVQTNMVWFHPKEHVLADCSTKEIQDMLAGNLKIMLVDLALNLYSTILLVYKIYTIIVKNIDGLYRYQGTEDLCESAGPD